MGTGITDVIGGPHDFLPPRSDEFQMYIFLMANFLILANDPFLFFHLNLKQLYLFLWYYILRHKNSEFHY